MTARKDAEMSDETVIEARDDVVETARLWSRAPESSKRVLLARLGRDVERLDRVMWGLATRDVSSDV